VNQTTGMAGPAATVINNRNQAARALLDRGADPNLATRALTPLYLATDNRTSRAATSGAAGSRSMIITALLDSGQSERAGEGEHLTRTIFTMVV
jgi:hypothetical protein